MKACIDIQVGPKNSGSEIASFFITTRTRDGCRIALRKKLISHLCFFTLLHTMRAIYYPDYPYNVDSITLGVGLKSVRRQLEWWDGMYRCYLYGECVQRAAPSPSASLSSNQL